MKFSDKVIGSEKRCLTKLEFIARYGENWRDVVPGAWITDMDFALGKESSLLNGNYVITEGMLYQGKVLNILLGLNFN